MDKIWYRNPSKSKVIGCCGGDEKNWKTTQNAQKSNVKKSFINPTMCNHSFQVIIGIDSLKHKQTQLLLELLGYKLSI